MKPPKILRADISAGSGVKGACPGQKLQSHPTNSTAVMRWKELGEVR
jgi:hypothetical protein